MTNKTGNVVLPSRFYLVSSRGGGELRRQLSRRQKGLTGAEATVLEPGWKEQFVLPVREQARLWGKKLAPKLGLERTRSRKSEKVKYITEKEEIFT